jgi:hypothetical protein
MAKKTYFNLHNFFSSNRNCLHPGERFPPRRCQKNLRRIRVVLRHHCVSDTFKYNYVRIARLMVLKSGDIFFSK